MFNIIFDILNEENLEKFLINMDIDDSFCKLNKFFDEIKNEL